MTDISKLIGEGLSKAGEVDLRHVILHDAKRQTKYNLWAAFITIDIYEDIFSPTLSGTIMITESFGLTTGIPILGDELLELEYDTPSFKQPVKKIFYITKIEERASASDKKQVYFLHFISKEAIIDLQSKISRPYSGTANEIVKRIYNEELKTDEALELDDADNIIKFVSPYWSPFKCISYATSRCLRPNSKIVTPNYLFYQTTKKFKLKSLSTLFGQTPVSKYFFDKNPARKKDDGGTSTRDIEREFQSIKELHYVKSQDYIKNTLEGALSHKVYGINLLRKSFTKKIYRIDEDFDKTGHLEKYPLFSAHANIADNGLLEARITAPQLFDGISDKADDILSKRISLLGQLDLFKLDIVVPGRTDIEVGDVVEIFLNEYKETDDIEKMKDKFDKIYSGKYLITAIRHRLSQSEHIMNMQVAKESALNQIVFGEQ